MALGVDLRKLHIKTEDDALEFLDIIESKLPQLKQVFKNSRMEKQSLVNRLRFAQEQGAKAPEQVTVADPNASVSERLTGPAPTVNKAEDRLAQLRNAVQPGEIGQLNVPVEQTRVPEDNTRGASSPEESTPDVAEEEVAKAAGSKSERTADDEVQQESDKVQEAVDKTKVSEADTTPVGVAIARKTKGKVEKKLSK